MNLPDGRTSLVGDCPTARPAADSCPATRPPLRVLVCDDNAISRKVADRLLQQLGCRPDLVSDGRQALNRLATQAYDLVLMDVLMPELGGLEATREIRRRQQDPSRPPTCGDAIVIVAMTASTMEGDREKCLEAGMDDFLAKPIRLEDLRAMLDRWGRSLACSRAAEATGGTNGAAASAREPVDLKRLRELTDGTEAGLSELVMLFLEQTTMQMEQLVEAVRAGQEGEMRRIAHSCAGASATCGMKDLVPLFRELECHGDKAKAANAEDLCAAAVHEFERLRAYLAPYVRSSGELAARA